jgi:hypothetical protein
MNSSDESSKSSGTRSESRKTQESHVPIRLKRNRDSFPLYTNCTFAPLPCHILSSLESTTAFTMRLPITPPINPSPQHLHTELYTEASNSHASHQHRAAHPTQSTMVGAGYIFTPTTSQGPMPASTRARDRRYTQFQPFRREGNAILDVHPGSIDAQAAQPTFPPIPYSQAFHATPATTTIQRWADPPPLDFNKSPYRCIPLPDMTPRPITLDPILAYSNRRTTQNGLNVSQPWSADIQHRDHSCAPATNPSVGSVTIMLPNGRGITVHAYLGGHSFVTVGDVLDALDRMLLGKPSRELCSCLSDTTALHYLRNRHEWAGLTRNEEGFDIWDLRIG